MSTSQKHIWAFHDGPMVGLFVGENPGPGANVSEYIRTDLADAMVAAAYDAAAVKAQDWASQGSDRSVWSVVASMASSDALAALDAIVARNVAEERGRATAMRNALLQLKKNAAAPWVPSSVIHAVADHALDQS